MRFFYRGISWYSLTPVTILDRPCSSLTFQGCWPFEVCPSLDWLLAILASRLLHTTSLKSLTFISTFSFPEQRRKFTLSTLLLLLPRFFMGRDNISISLKHDAAPLWNRNCLLSIGRYRIFSLFILFALKLWFYLVLICINCSSLKSIFTVFQWAALVGRDIL